METSSGRVIRREHMTPRNKPYRRFFVLSCFRGHARLMRGAFAAIIFTAAGVMAHAQQTPRFQASVDVVPVDVTVVDGHDIDAGLESGRLLCMGHHAGRGEDDGGESPSHQAGMATKARKHEK